jgi:hypothetical protein
VDLYRLRLISYQHMHLPLHSPQLILKWQLLMGLHNLEEKISVDGVDCKITLWDQRDILTKLNLMELWEWMLLMLRIMRSGDHNKNIKLLILLEVHNQLLNKLFLF